MIYRQVEKQLYPTERAAMNIQMLEWALDVTKGSKGDFTGAHTAATVTFH